MYTYMEDALDYLTDYASKHHIRIMWASFSPITPPGSNFEYRSVVMNSNWHNPKEFIFQLAHEISHVIHGDKGDIYYYHACFTEGLINCLGIKKKQPDSKTDISNYLILATTSLVAFLNNQFNRLYLP